MPAFDYRIRYGECDQQGVVFNAHYMAYVDDAVDCWIRSLDARFETTFGWEVTVKRTDITWHSPARFGDTLTLDLSVSRWGGTSFDVTVEGLVAANHVPANHVADRPVFSAVTTYVVVDHEHFRPLAIPDSLRAHLGG